MNSVLRGPTSTATGGLAGDQTPQRRTGRRQSALPHLALGLWLAVLVGCASPRLAPPDVHGPSWSVREGQVVWRPRRDAPEVAGDLLLSVHCSGDFLLEFSKSPLPLVQAHRVGTRWEASFPTQGRRFAGRGAGSDRLLWLSLPDALAGRTLPASLSFSTSGPEGWSFENPRTGERIEGYLSP